VIQKMLQYLDKHSSRGTITQGRDCVASGHLGGSLDTRWVGDMIAYESFRTHKPDHGGYKGRRA
jgi:hypothetical protein